MRHAVQSGRQSVAHVTVCALYLSMATPSCAYASIALYANRSSSLPPTPRADAWRFCALGPMRVQLLQVQAQLQEAEKARSAEAQRIVRDHADACAGRELLEKDVARLAQELTTVGVLVDWTESWDSCLGRMSHSLQSLEF